MTSEAGSAVLRGSSPGGRKTSRSCCQRPRKVKGEAVSVVLFQEQFETLQEAIANWRETQQILQRMQGISRMVICRILPDTSRCK